MSCKVLSGAGTSGVGQLLFAVPEADSAPAPTAEPAPEPAEADEVSELHGKIVGLERALQINVKQAREVGFREGEKAGREQACKEVQPVLERLSRSLTDIASLRSRVRRDAEADLVTLAIAIARRILRRELAVEPEAILGVIKAALEKAQARDICRIRLHPSHAPLIRKSLEVTGAAAEIVADPSLQAGDVIVETKRGDLDGSVETQLQEIERGFADRLREAD